MIPPVSQDKTVADLKGLVKNLSWMLKHQQRESATSAELRLELSRMTAAKEKAKQDLLEAEYELAKEKMSASDNRLLRRALAFENKTLLAEKEKLLAENEKLLAAQQRREKEGLEYEQFLKDDAEAEARADMAASTSAAASMPQPKA
jgi:hypothetical protein